MVLCSACTDIFQGKRTRWMGSHMETVVHYLPGNTEALLKFEWNEPLTSDWAWKLQGDWEDVPENGTESDTESNAENDTENWSDAAAEVQTLYLFNSKLAGCRNMDYRYIHHATGQHLISAASKGCQLCGMFVAQLSQEDMDVLSRESPCTLPGKNQVDYPTTYCIEDILGIGTGDRLFNVTWSVHGYYMVPNPNGSNREIHYSVQFGNLGVRGHPLPDSKVSFSDVVGMGDSSISLVRQWIAACETHEACKLRSLPNAREDNPSSTFARILDVLGDDGNTNCRIRESKNIPADSLYMTLSHCWGSSDQQPLRLTLSTLEMMKASISMEDLPKTFRDAVNFTRTLGIRFLWIDSLCIIQDSDEDWEDQSIKMCEIYSHSFLNIAATGAENSSGGLFSKRQTSSIRPLRVFLPQPAQVSCWFDRSHIPRYFDALDTAMWQTDVEESPLCKRGWVVQERALSKRSLHFGKRQLYWECSTISACETVPESLAAHPAYSRRPIFFKVNDPLRKDLSETISKLERGQRQTKPPFFSIWGKIVETFSSASLTKDTDKLIAILGIANAMASRTKLEYTAGLWHHNIPVQLMWHTKTPVERSSTLHAPSWSWASVKSEVLWRYDDFDYTCIEILRVVQIPIGSTGGETALFGCRLRIRGNLIPGTLFRANGSSGSQPEIRLAIRRSPVDVDFFPDANEENLGDVFCVPIEIAFGWINKRPVNSHIGLVITPTDEKGVFKRIGFFELTMPERHHGYGFSMNIGLMDYQEFPTTIDPLQEVDEQFYLQYEDIEDALAMIGADEESEDVSEFSGGFIFDII